VNPYRHDHNPLNADFHGGICSACEWERDEGDATGWQPVDEAVDGCIRILGPDNPNDIFGRDANGYVRISAEGNPWLHQPGPDGEWRGQVVKLPADDQDWSPTRPCPTCDGRKVVHCPGPSRHPEKTQRQREAAGLVYGVDYCHGMHMGHKCPTCDGAGTLPRYAIRLTNVEAQP
jgi:hypothetical protein